ncbi:hypothetical protein KAJ89_04650 [Candidatus Parcubacteria bacterium]|nr:hypothetical protein [Candidatus Parcubacteria bacterium]
MEKKKKHLIKLLTGAAVGALLAIGAFAYYFWSTGEWDKLTYQFELNKLGNRLDKVSTLHDKLTEKKSEISRTKKELYVKIKEYRGEVAVSSKVNVLDTYAEAEKNQQVRLNLELIQINLAYIAKLKQTEHVIATGNNEILFLKRKFKTDYEVATVLNRVEIRILLKEINFAIEKYMPFAGELVINTDDIEMESTQKIWQNIIEEEKQKQKEVKQQEERRKTEGKRSITTGEKGETSLRERMGNEQFQKKLANGDLLQYGIMSPKWYLEETENSFLINTLHDEEEKWKGKKDKMIARFDYILHAGEKYCLFFCESYLFKGRIEKIIFKKNYTVLGLVFVAQKNGREFEVSGNSCSAYDKRGGRYVPIFARLESLSTYKQSSYDEVRLRKGSEIRLFAIFNDMPSDKFSNGGMLCFDNGDKGDSCANFSYNRKKSAYITDKLYR